MLKRQTSSLYAASRLALVALAAIAVLTFTAASTNAAGFSFMESVREFFGIALIQNDGSGLTNKNAEATPNEPAFLVPTVLAPGDLAFSCFQADNAGGEFAGDALCFVLLVPVGSGTTVFFTDNGYLAPGGTFRTNENVLRWVAQADLPAGAKVTFVAPGGTGPASTAQWTGINPINGAALTTAAFGLAGGGDNIAALQNPTFGGTDALSGTAITQLTFGSATFPTMFTTGSGNATSALAAGLTDGTNAVSLASTDDGRYDETAVGSVESGTRAAVGASLNTDTFWLTSGTPFTPGNTPATFTITAPNAAPTISAASGVTRQEGSVGSSSTIATVGDVDTGAASVVVTVNGGSTATVNGVTVSGITNTAGTVTANVAAACGATSASFTLTATDPGALTATSTLTLTVTPNTAPVLTYINPGAVAFGGSTLITPATGPTDNGSIATIAVQSAGTYTGAISVNNTTGVVTISGAQPAGTHTITIRATDNCGTFTDATFSLTVNAAQVVFRLNEVEVNTPNPNFEACQYVEILGTAGEVVPANNFFTSIDGDAGQFGIVTYIADISGTTFGSNGTITIISNSDTCPGRIYPAGTTVVQTNSIAMGFGAETFLLISTTNPGQLFEGQDLDVDNDGTIDAAFGVTPVDGIGWIINQANNTVYGGAPVLTQGSVDLPDAASRFAGNTTAFSGAAWFWGNLAGSDNSTAYADPRSSNFPTCGVLTPGVGNTLPGACSPSNSAPVANADIYGTPEDTQINVAAPGVLGNDTDADLNPLTAVLIAAPIPAQGGLTFNADGSFIFVPALNFNGPATFTYQANDGTVNSATTTVTINVQAFNDAPDAVNDSPAAILEDSGANVINVLANDTDPENNTLSITAVTQGTNGLVTNNSTNVSYTPAPNFFGTDSFTYTISDGNGGSDTATVNVTVTDVPESFPFVLNEIAVDTPDPVSEPCQYIEIKGTAGSIVPSNVFFLSIDGDAGQFGIVSYVGNLSGQLFGSNGTITIVSNSDVCAGRTYPVGTTLVQVDSIATGFGAETFLLLSTTSPSQLFEGQDLDVNNDGVLDPSFNITPIDGVGWVVNQTFNRVYGGVPTLFEGVDVPDAATRFLGDSVTQNAGSWYFGELAGAANSTTYTSPTSANFPSCGQLTPGAQNTLSGSCEALPPVITYTPLQDTASNAAVPLSVSVTDNSSSIASVMIYYSVNGAPFVSASCSGTYPSYTCTLPGQPTGTAVAYFVGAVDPSGNTAFNTNISSPNLYSVGAAPVPEGTYTNIALSAGSSLGGDVLVQNDLDLGGVLTGGTFTVTIDCAATVTGAAIGRYIDGNVRKNFCSTGTFSFPVGQGNLTPVDVNITALAVNPSSLTVKSFANRINGFDPATSLNRFWSLTESGDLTATLSFTYLQSDVFGNEADYRVWRRESNGTDTNFCPTTPCVNTATDTLGPIAGISQFSLWTGSGPLAPTASNAVLSGRVTTADGRGIRNARVTVTGNSLATPLVAVTGSLGWYSFDDLRVGETYVVTVESKRFTFSLPSRVVSLSDNVSDVDFAAMPQE